MSVKLRRSARIAVAAAVCRDAFAAKVRGVSASPCRSASLIALPRRARPYLRFGAPPCATMADGYSSISPAEGQQGLRTYIDGKLDGPTIVFVHGWPDDHALWDKQVAHLKDRFRCVTTDLPGFSGDDTRAEKWGYSTEEVVKRIERTCEAVGNGEPIVLVAHDFGWWVLFDFPSTYDVQSSALSLCLAFLLGRPIGDGLARMFACILGSPSGARIARAATCYPYYYTWKHLLCSGEKPKAMMPQCPLMFLHGTAGVKKVLTFHASRWAESVQERDGSSAQGIDQASHWVTRDQPDEVNRRLDEFLADL
eukprot:jgi/Undpi1/13881/HiC_scaffold_9.g03532.m1